MLIHPRLHRLARASLAFLLLANSFLTSSTPIFATAAQSTVDKVARRAPTNTLADISITDAGFSPSEITVWAGAEVTWQNDGALPHGIASGTPIETPITPETPKTLYLPIIQHKQPDTSPKNDHLTNYLPLVSSSKQSAADVVQADEINPLPQAPSIQIDEPLTLQPAVLVEPPTAQAEWRSTLLQPGASFTYKFSDPGTYEYYDPSNTKLTGRVVVRKNNPPMITLTTPSEGAVVGTLSVSVQGTVSDDGQITRVFVNQQQATVNGTAFSAALSLPIGAQVINVIAEDDGGLTALASRMVYVDGEGPLIEVNAPKAQQSVYQIRPTFAISYEDFLTTVNPATLQVVLTPRQGTPLNVTSHLAIGERGATGTIATDLMQGMAYTLSVTIADQFGNPGSYLTNFYVPEGVASITPPLVPANAGWISGVIYDSATCGGEKEYQPIACQGIAGAKVTLARVNESALRSARVARIQQLMEEGQDGLPRQPALADVTDPLSGTVVTGPDGFFAFPVGETANYWLRVEKNGYTYGQRAAEIVRERSTPVNEIYLTPLDSALTLCGEAGCNHTSGDGQMKVEIPAGAIPSGQSINVTATEFDQVEFLPSGELPPGTWETYAFNLGGDSDYTFQKPITVSIKNSKGFAPGAEIPLGYWNQSLMQWEHEGMAVVDPSAQWVVMQVLHFSNHDPNYPQTLLSTPSTELIKESEPTNCPVSEGGCSITLRHGILREEFSLPAVQVLDGEFAPTFHYDSNQADPSKLIAIGFTLPGGIGFEVGSTLQAELFIEGKKTGNYTFAARDLLAGKDSANFRYMWNGRDAQGNRLPPGVYRYDIHLRIPYRAQYFATLNNRFGGPPDLTRPTGRFTTATSDQWIYGSVTLASNSDSPFGAGWQLNSQQRLYADEVGHLMIVEGSSIDEYYFPGINQLEANTSDASVSEVLQQVTLNAQANTSTEGIFNQPAFEATPPPAVDNATIPLIESAEQPASAELSQEQGLSATANIDNPTSTEVTIDSPPVEVDEAASSLSTSTLAPQINVGGVLTQSTIWTLAKSPYTLTTELTVPKGVTLTIEPGVTVRSNYPGLTVLGHLQALGTASQSITFTSMSNSTAKLWSGISFEQGTGYLQDVTVYSANSIEVNDVLTGEVRIENSRIISGGQSMWPDYSLEIVNSRVAVSNTRFIGNGDSSWDYPVYISGANSVVTLTNNLFQGNTNNRIRLANDAMMATNPTLVPQTGLDGYQLNTKFTVPTGITLTLAPGTVVIAALGWNYGMNILGHLQALGTVTQPITFTGETYEFGGLTFEGGTGHLREVTVRWHGLSTEGVSYNIQAKNVLTGEVRIENSRITAIDYGVACRINIANSHVTVSDTLFSGDAYEWGYGICAKDSTSVVSIVDSSFQDKGRPFTLHTASVRQIRNNRFVNNTYAQLTGDATLLVPLTLGAQSGMLGYEILGNITVPVGSLLTIEPGVALHWSYDKGLIVNGSLLALGTASQPITLTSTAYDSPGQWQGITFNGGRGVLKHTTIRYAATGIAAMNSQLSLRESTVNSNRLDGIRLSGNNTTFSINSSSIVGNGSASYGLRNETDQLVDARVNWWGHPSGPFHPTSNPSGQGNRVSDNVLFEPWLDEEVYTLAIVNRTETDHTKLTYNPNDRSYTRYYLNGTEVHFNLDGSHAYTLEPAGHKTAYTYNPDGTLATLQIIPKGESSARWTWRFHYSNQRLTSILDPAGRSTTVTINPHGQLTKVEFPDATSYQFAYDAHDRMTQEIDKHGGVSTTLYDGYGRVKTHIAPAQTVLDPESGQTSVIRATKTFTPSASSYALVNNSVLGDPTNPAPSLPTHEELVDRVAYGRGERSGHTDHWGNWLDETDGEGRTTRYQRDDSGNLTRRVEPDGDCVEYTYDERGNVLSEARMGAVQCNLPPANRDPAQVQLKRYSYEARFNQIKRQTDALGNTTLYVYDYEEVQGMAGKLIRIEYPPIENGNGVIVTPTVRYTYNALGLLESEIDARGVVNKYIYTQGTVDEANGTFAPGVTPVPGLLAQQIEDFGGINRTTTYRAYDAAGNPGEVEGPGCCGQSQRTRYSYDAWGRVLSSKDALGIVTRFEYDAGGNLTRQTVDYTADGTSGRNVVTHYQYDLNNRRLSESTQADGLLIQTLLSYDINGKLTSQEDGLGQRTTYFYDEADQLIKSVDPAGYSTVYSYTLDNRTAQITDADGYVTRFIYDGFGQPIALMQDEAGLRLTLSNTYDLNGNLLTVTDAVGVQTCYEYDSHNRRTTEIQDCGAGKLNLRTQSIYDLNGNLLRTIDPRGVVTQLEYDALNRRTKLIRDANGLQLTTRYQYDAAGNLIEMRDERGVVTQYSYDALNRMVKSCQDAIGLNLCTSYGYDRLNHQSSVTDPKGVTTQAIYNAFGKPLQQIADAGGLSASTSFGYDNAINQVRITDANGNSTLYHYTVRNELAVESYADGTQIHYSYDGRGNLRLRTNQDGTTISNSYDGASRLLQRDFSTGGWQKFGYDAASRMLTAEQSMNGHSSLLTFDYNALNDVTKTTQMLDGASWTVGYGYEYVAGKRTLTYPSGVQRIESYDPLNRLDQVQQGDSSVIANYDYHELDSYFTLAYANGLTNRTDYDALYRTTRLSSAVADYRYGYDAAGNRTYMQRAHKANQPADVYQYDKLYQVTQVWYGANATDPTAVTSFNHKQSYQLDLVYNRLAVENDGVKESYLPNNGQRLTNPMNRYEQVDGVTFSYDLRGNTLNDGRNSYAYDLLNRQIGVNNTSGLSEYIYDALGKRIAKTVGGVTTHYVYDTGYRILEEHNGDGSLAARYTYGAGIDEPLTMERSGNTYFYHRDAQGSVSEMTDATGALVERYEYDIYGMVRVFDGAGGTVSVSGISNPYLYTGRQYELESGNYYFRARMYDPKVGRFLQMDPEEYIDGMGTYVSYFVVNGVDPLGLFTNLYSPDKEIPNLPLPNTPALVCPARSAQATSSNCNWLIREIATKYMAAIAQYAILSQQHRYLTYVANELHRLGCKVMRTGFVGFCLAIVDVVRAVVEEVVEEFIPAPVSMATDAEDLITLPIEASNLQQKIVYDANNTAAMISDPAKRHDELRRKFDSETAIFRIEVEKYKSGLKELEDLALKWQSQCCKVCKPESK